MIDNLPTHGAPEKKAEFENIQQEWKKAKETGNYKEYLSLLDAYLLLGLATTAFTNMTELGDTMEALSHKITPVVYPESGDTVDSVDENTVRINGLDLETVEIFLGPGHSQAKESSQAFAKSIMGKIYSEEIKH